jgi:hypothetical protein
MIAGDDAAGEHHLSSLSRLTTRFCSRAADRSVRLDPTGINDPENFSTEQGAI